jgi:hypothetical protein
MVLSAVVQARWWMTPECVDLGESNLTGWCVCPLVLAVLGGLQLIGGR